MNGAQGLIEELINQGVEVVFGIPGGVVLTIYDVIYEAQRKNRLKHILMRHEQAAAHAADGYARATGKVGVCIATSGPGATNIVTGLATAYMDSIPMVAVTGQVNSALIGRDSFQEADITGITMPITKHNYLVKNPDDLVSVVREAFHIAATGRPGPVLIDIPVNVSDAEIPPPPQDEIQLRGYKPKLEGHKKQINIAAGEIKRAERPVFYVGGGVISAGAHRLLLKAAEKVHAPVVSTLMGLGAFPASNPLFLGMLGMHGTYAANMAISHADVIFAVGVRFDDRVTGRTETFAKDATIVHVDVDPAEIGKNVRSHIPIVGDAANVLETLLPQLKAANHDEWIAQVDEWRQKHPLKYSHPKDGSVSPQYVVEKIHEVSEGKAIITTEVGQNQMWAAQFYKYNEPRTFLSSGGLGTMGFGFPAAIGAQLGCPGRLVVDIAGDGSIFMNIQELATVVEHNIPVKVCILNNQVLGMVHQWQRLFYGRRYSNSILTGNPNPAKIAEAFGAVGISVEKTEDVVPALKEAFSNGRPTFVNFMVHTEENVLPMVPRGKSITNMITEYKE